MGESSKYRQGSTSSQRDQAFLLPRNHYSLVVLVPDSKSRPLDAGTPCLLDVRARRWVVLHVALHPVWKLLLPTEPKPHTFA